MRHSLSQVEDALQATFERCAALQGWTVRLAESVDVAVEQDCLPLLLITTKDYRFDVADENWMSIHSATIDVEAVSATPNAGFISRVNRDALGHVIGAIAADRQLGIGLQDVQETDIAPIEPEGKDADSASLRLTVLWFTARDNHFVIT